MPPSIFRRVIATLNLYCRLLVLRLHLFLSQTAPLRKSPTIRSILLIGDGTAEGVGDIMGKTGLSSRISVLLSESDTLRFTWRVISAGKLWSTAYDWSPKNGPLFDKTFSNPAFRDAEVVLLTFGMHDDPETAPDHVAAIAEALVRMGKHVVVTGLFNPYAPKTEKHVAFRSASHDLKQRLTVVKQQIVSTDSGSLCFDADPAKVCVMGTDTLAEELGFYTFNSRGYRMFAADLIDDVAAAAKRVEWAYWKHRLSAPSS